MKAATRHAIEVSRKLLGSETGYRPLVLGSLHGLQYSVDTHLDWVGRGAGVNVNFSFDYINSGNWDLILNCCCEHMYPMSEITLPGYYVLQTNNRYGDQHINRCLDINSFINQLDLNTLIYHDTIIVNGAEYYTVIGEK